MDCKEIKPVNPKGNQPWILIGKTDAETLILWPPDANSQLIGKDPDAGKDWSQKKKAAEGENGQMASLNGHEFEKTSGDSKGQGSLACCSPWSRRVGHDLATEPTKLKIHLSNFA